jgi:holo-[acyl-carrier protein] synthase
MAAPEPTPKKPDIILGRADHLGRELSVIGYQSSVLGIGIDIVETERIEQSLKRFGDRFLKRVYHPAEIAYARSMKFPALHLAARFAAKEAISKAFGTGIGKRLGWTDMEIRRKDSGEPYVVLHGKGAALAKQRGVAQVLVSLSHCKAYSAANAILLSNPASSIRHPASPS